MKTFSAAKSLCESLQTAYMQHRVLSKKTVVISISILLIAAAASAQQLDPVLRDALREHKAGNLKRAIEMYSEAIQKNPRSAEAFNWRGMAYDDLGKLDEALDDYNRALTISPDYADAYNNRGEVYRQKKDYANALKDFQNALRFDPKFAEPHYNIGLVFEAEGKKDQAAREFLAYIKAKPDAADQKEIMKKIQALTQAAAPPGAPPAPAPPTAGAPAPTAPPPGPPPPPEKALAKAPMEKKAPGPPPKVAQVPQPRFKPGAPPAQPAPVPGLESVPFLSELPIPHDVLALATQPPDPMQSLVSLAIYLIFAALLFMMAQKIGVGLPWLAFVPIANLYILVKCAGKPGWWLILLLIPLVNIVIWLLVSLGVAQQRGKSVLWAILFFIPCTNPIALAYLGLSR